MSLDVGKVQKYSNSGSGYIRGLFAREEIYFESSIIPDRKIIHRLELQAVGNLFFWVEVNRQGGKLVASKLWVAMKAVPDNLPLEILENITHRLATEWLDNSHSLPYWADELRGILISSTKYTTLREIWREVEEKGRNKLATLQVAETSSVQPQREFLERYLAGTGITFQIDSLGRVLYRKGTGFLKHKSVERTVKETRRKQLDEPTQLSPAELQKKLRSYRTNRDGIRLEIQLRNVCLECGSTNVKPLDPARIYFRVCQACFTQWYVNHCWQCSDLIDSRDINHNRQCTRCSWYKCNTCGACHQDGCHIP